MKKTLIVTLLATATAVGSFAQGYVDFNGFLGNAKNNYTTPGTAVNQAGLYVELFAVVNGSAQTPGVATATGVSGAPTASSTYTVAAAWNAIMNDANFVAVTPLTPAVTSANGGFSGSIQQTSNLGVGTFTMYEVAWYAGAGGTDNTIALASAAGDYVGWSKAFTYTTTAGTVPPPAALSSATVGNIFVGGSVVASPEPTTVALAGLGGLALLGLRRRK